MRLKNLLFLIINVFTPLLIFGQEIPNCWELVKKSNEEYKIKNYEEALISFKKAVECTKELRGSDYYNGACIASLAKNEQLTLSYLKIAIDKGWENVEHMVRDKDLDFIKQTKEYAQLIDQVKHKYDYLNSHFTGINVGDLPFAIPFCVNNKWGWLHKDTKKVLVKPVFSFTDFKCAKGLFFEEMNQLFILSNDLKVIKIKEYYSDGPIMLMSSNNSEIVDDENFKGFTISNSQISKYSDKYINVKLISSQKWGIALRKQDSLVGIINENGDIIKGFEFVYSYIIQFPFSTDSLHFIGKKKNKKDYDIYNSKGIKAMKQSFSSVEFVYNHVRIPNEKWIFIGNAGKNFSKVRINQNYNILDNSKLKLLFSKQYDDIIVINGPTNDVDRQGNLDAQYNGADGITADYFLVKKGTNYFYVDMKGIEYKPK
jgi:hypothetical protein